MSVSPVAREKFSRRDRLRKRREFQECYASGLRVSARFFQLFLVGRQSSGHSRLGLSVPKRVGNAVERNRLRRAFREIFRRHRASLSADYDMVLNVRSAARKASFTDLLQDYTAALSRVSRSKPPR